MGTHGISLNAIRTRELTLPSCSMRRFIISVFEIIFHALPAPKRLPQKYLIVRITTNPAMFTGIAKYIGRTMPVKKHTVDVAYIGKTLFTANNSIIAPMNIHVRSIWRIKSSSCASFCFDCAYHHQRLSYCSETRRTATAIESAIRTSPPKSRYFFRFCFIFNSSPRFGTLFINIFYNIINFGSIRKQNILVFYFTDICDIIFI